MTKQELLNGLTEEQIAKAEACQSADEIFALAKEEGVELSEEQLEYVSGGGCGKDKKKDDDSGHRKIDSVIGGPKDKDPDNKNPINNPY